MTLIVYHKLYSPPCRATIFTLLALNITFEERVLDSHMAVTFSRECQKRNLHCTIPTIIEDDFVLWDSHAITTYLANAYDKTNRFYPIDPRRRAIVDNRLHFNNEILTPFLRDLARQIIKYGKVKEISTDYIKWINETYTLIGQLFVENTFHRKPKKWQYVAGDTFTIADFHYITTLTTMELILPINSQLFPDITNYLALCKPMLINYTINEVGLQEFKEFIPK